MPRSVVSIWKFLVAGKGLSVRTGKYFAESMLVGVAVGFVVVAFRWMIEWGHRLLLQGIGHHRDLSRLCDGAAMGKMYSVEALLDWRRILLIFLPVIGMIICSVIRSEYEKGGNI